MKANIYVRRPGDSDTTRARQMFHDIPMIDGPRRWAEQHAGALGAGTVVFICDNDGVYVLHIEPVQQPRFKVVD